MRNLRIRWTRLIETETDGTQIPVPRFIRPGLDRYTFNTHYEKHDNLSEDHAKLQDLHELLEKRLAILGTMKGSGTQSLRQDFKKVMLRLGGWIAELEELGKAPPQPTRRAWLIYQ